MNEIKRIYKQSPLQTISVAFSLIAAIISLIVGIAVWQHSINLRVQAAELALSSQQMTLQSISDKLDDINTRGAVNAQRILDTNDKVALIYQFFKK